MKRYQLRRSAISRETSKLSTQNMEYMELRKTKWENINKNYFLHVPIDVYVFRKKISWGVLIGVSNILSGDRTKHFKQCIYHEALDSIEVNIQVNSIEPNKKKFVKTNLTQFYTFFSAETVFGFILYFIF